MEGGRKGIAKMERGVTFFFLDNSRDCSEECVKILACVCQCTDHLQRSFSDISSYKLAEKSQIKS